MRQQILLRRVILRLSLPVRVVRYQELRDETGEIGGVSLLRVLLGNDVKPIVDRDVNALLQDFGVWVS